MLPGVPNDGASRRDRWRTTSGLSRLIFSSSATKMQRFSDLSVGQLMKIYEKKNHQGPRPTSRNRWNSTWWATLGSTKLCHIPSIAWWLHLAVLFLTRLSILPCPGSHKTRVQATRALLHGCRSCGSYCWWFSLSSCRCLASCGVHRCSSVVVWIIFPQPSYL